MEIETGPLQATGVRSQTEEERRAEQRAYWAKRVAEAKAAREAPEYKPEPFSYDDKEDEYLAEQASEFRDRWISRYSLHDGDFEETTKIPNKRFTHNEPARSDHASTSTTLQIFSVKVSRIRGGLQWPLRVFGMVAIRDCLDQKRNIIFNRPRDNCQIITQKVPYLKLTGPTRAVLFLDPVTFEVDLKVKGSTEAEDDCLSFLAANYINSPRLNSQHFKRVYPCRLSTLEFELASMTYSVEATIDVKFIDGSWPDGFHAQFAASTGSIKGAQVILLDSAGDKVQVDCEKNIKLSRCVASVETSEHLRISVKALRGGRVIARKSMVFKPMTARTSIDVLPLGFCKLCFTISWSLITTL